MHENQYNGTGYVDPEPVPICNRCESEQNLRYVDRADVWGEDGVAHCARHGQLDEDAVRWIEL